MGTGHPPHQGTAPQKLLIYLLHADGGSGTAGANLAFLLPKPMFR